MLTCSLYKSTGWHSWFESKRFDFASARDVEEQGGTEVASALLTQLPWVRFSAFPRIFLLMLLRFIDGTDWSSGWRLKLLIKPI